MAGEIQLNGTTALTESSGAVTLNNVNSATNRTNIGLGSSATASFASLTINGVTNQGFPSGTKMLFQQTAAPTGWTKDTTNNDVALRVVSGAVGSGGSVAFETAFASQTIPTHTLATTEIPSHNHSLRERSSSSGTETGNGYTFGSFTSTTGSTGGGQAHGHGSIDLDVSYVDVIIATKD